MNYQIFLLLKELEILRDIKCKVFLISWIPKLLLSQSCMLHFMITKATNLFYDDRWYCHKKDLDFEKVSIS